MNATLVITVRKSASSLSPSSITGFPARRATPGPFRRTDVSGRRHAQSME